MNITVKQIKYNITPIAKRNIKYIVVHDTGNKSLGANAQTHYNYFNSGKRNASADFFVDTTSIWQVNDYTKNYTWHVGDGINRYSINNMNSIGIEMCVNIDGNFNTTMQNTIKLMKKLKRIYPTAQIVRHYDASRKNCPASLSKDNWKGWLKFMNELNKKLTWKEIIRRKTDKPDEWIKAIEAAVNASMAEGDTGELEILRYLPELLEKVSND